MPNGDDVNEYVVDEGNESRQENDEVSSADLSEGSSEVNEDGDAIEKKYCG